MLSVHAGGPFFSMILTDFRSFAFQASPGRHRMPLSRSIWLASRREVRLLSGSGAYAKTVPSDGDLAGAVASACAHGLSGHMAAGNHVRDRTSSATTSTIYREN
jgi:hypothetical protein